MPQRVSPPGPDPGHSLLEPKPNMSAPRKKGGSRPEKHGKFYRVRVPGYLPNGDKSWRYRSTETDMLPIAEDIGATVVELQTSGGERGQALLLRVFNDKMSLRDMMAALAAQDTIEIVNGRTATLSLATIAARAVDAADAKSIADLVELFDTPARPRWQVAKVRAMFPRDFPHRIDWFTATNLQDLLNGLQPQRKTEFDGLVTLKTKRVYRVALSAFAVMLMGMKLIGANPTQGSNIKLLETFADVHADEIRYYTEAQVRRIVDALADNPVVQAMVCIAFATSAEFAAICRMTKESLEGRKLFRVHGTKNEWRENRLCTVSIAWCWPIIERYFATLAPGQFVVPRAKKGKRTATEDGVNAPDRQLRHALKAACATAKSPYYAFHNFRHSMAVYWIQAGVCIGRIPKLDEQWIQRQLGHKPGSIELRRTYGRFLDEARHLDQSMHLIAMQDAEEMGTAAAAMAQDERDDLSARRERRGVSVVSAPVRRPLFKIRNTRRGA